MKVRKALIINRIIMCCIFLLLACASVSAETNAQDNGENKENLPASVILSQDVKSESDAPSDVSNETIDQPENSENEDEINTGSTETNTETNAETIQKGFLEDGNLSLNSTGGDVEYLQSQLEKLGYLKKGYTHGLYDNNTQNAVKIFQVYNGLRNPDGICGRWSKGKLASGALPFSAITSGDRGSREKWVQQLLYGSGYLAARPDGVWGGKSKSGVALLADEYAQGTQDQVTLDTLNLLLSGSVTKINNIAGKFSVGDSDNEIRKITLRLNLLGFKPVIKSDFDDDLLQWIRLYQFMCGMNPDGVIGSYTEKYLNGYTISADDIKNGTKSEAARTLQRRLYYLGCYDGGADGVVGSRSIAGVNNFKRKYLLEENSLMTIGDWKELLDFFDRANAYTLKINKNYRYGEKSSSIEFLQNKIKDLGFADYNVDGKFGSYTRGSIEMFQLYYGMSADGVCGRKTISQLLAKNLEKYDIDKAEKNSFYVRAVQRKLYSVGKYRASADGKIGPTTRAGIKAFQKSIGIEQNGILNTKTSYRLFAAQVPKLTAIVVDIASQKLTYYYGGVAKLISDVVTGKNNTTPRGTFSVVSKMRNINLVGPGYVSHVNYWIAFKGNQIGFHDASWRNAFGGSIYIRNGSHGCVNMPLQSVINLYNLVSIGTKVIIR